MTTTTPATKPNTPKNVCGTNGGRTKNGTPCARKPVPGYKRCRLHAGITRTQAAAQGAVTIEIAKWGFTDTTIDPGEVLLRLVTQSFARVEMLSQLLGQAYQAAEALRAAHAAAQIVVAPDTTDRGAYTGAGFGEDRDEPDTEDPELQAARLNLNRIFTSGGVSALVGVKVDADRFGRLYIVDEGIRGLAAIEAAERDRCASFAAKAVAAGLAERQVRLAEVMAVQLVAVVFGVLDDLGIARDDLATREAVSRRLMAVSGGTGGPQAALEGVVVPR